MQVRDRHNDNGIAIQTKNKSIRKPCKKASSKPRFYFS